MRTESWREHNERLIYDADRVIAESKRILSQIRLREMGQVPLEGWEAQVIPFPHRFRTPEVHEINGGEAA
jgi:hypothetical protein